MSFATVAVKIAANAAAKNRKQKHAKKIHQKKNNLIIHPVK